jgi:hypothetical protein
MIQADLRRMGWTAQAREANCIIMHNTSLVCILEKFQNCELQSSNLVGGSFISSYPIITPAATIGLSVLIHLWCPIDVLSRSIYRIPTAYFLRVIDAKSLIQLHLLLQKCWSRDVSDCVTFLLGHINLFTGPVSPVWSKLHQHCISGRVTIRLWY